MPFFPSKHGYIVQQPGLCSGRPSNDGHRVTVCNLVELYLDGMTPAEISARFSPMSLAKVHAALAYYYDNQNEIDREIEQTQRDGEV